MGIGARLSFALPEQRRTLAAQAEATLLECHRQGSEGAQHLSESRGVPVHRLLLQQGLAAAQIKPLRRTSPQFELLLQQLASQGARGHHDQIIHPQSISRQRFCGRRRKHQVGAGVAMGPPELPPQPPLRPPVALRVSGAQALLPKNRGWLGWPRREALQQSRIGHQPIQATRQAARHQQHQCRGNHQQHRAGEGRHPQG